MSDPATWQRLVDRQRARLRHTYHDFGGDPTYVQVAGFFYNEVYNPARSAERVDALATMYDKLQKHLGRELVRQLSNLIVLDDLTRKMDLATARLLTPQFTDEEYERAYAAQDNYADRLKQIRLIADALGYFHGMAHRPGIGLALTLLRPYAALKGYGDMLSFLQEGYRAFRSIDDIGFFRQQILAREVSRLNRIFALYGRGVPRENTKETRRIARELGIRNADRMELNELIQQIHQWA